MLIPKNSCAAKHIPAALAGSLAKPAGQGKAAAMFRLLAARAPLARAHRPHRMREAPALALRTMAAALLVTRRQPLLEGRNRAARRLDPRRLGVEVGRQRRHRDRLAGQSLDVPEQRPLVLGAKGDGDA